MAIEQYASKQLFKSLAADELAPCGAFRMPKQLELAHVQMAMLKKGSHAGTERIRLKLFLNESLTKLYATSDWMNLSSISGLGPSSWLGRVTFAFARPHIWPGVWYYTALEVDAYTPNEDAFYLGFRFDWPEPINNQMTAPAYGLEMAIFGYRFITQ